MNHEAIYAGLGTIFYDVFDNESITLTPSTTAKDVAGWDSTRMILIILAIEEKYGIKFSSSELDKFRSVGDLVSAIAAKLPETPNS